MHWVIQENLFKEHEWPKIIETLERFKFPYSVHKVVPFTGECIPPVMPACDKVVCLGSYSMRHSAELYGWQPGVYDLLPYDFEQQCKHWGEHMLNYGCAVMRFADVQLSEPSFIRPTVDSKLFAGQAFWPKEFHEWQRKVVELKEDYGTGLTGDTMVQVCEHRIINAEYRYWIVDSHIATRSLYKRGKKVIYDRFVDERMDAFVKARIAEWCPHVAFVIDVCDTPVGTKIVELNNLNSAGFYAGDVSSIVLALEAMENSYA